MTVLYLEHNSYFCNLRSPVFQGKDGLPSEAVSSVSAGANAVSGKGATDQPLTSEQGVYYPPTSCYDYYYPGKVFTPCS